MKTLMLGIVSVLLLVSAQRFVQKENRMNNKMLLAASSSPQSIQGDKVKISKENLPEATKKILAGDVFKGWEVATAYKVKEEYEVELKKDKTTQTVKFDKEGKLK